MDTQLISDTPTTTHITDYDFDVVFSSLEHYGPLDIRDVPNVAKHIIDAGDFTRTLGSALFIINRMHVIMFEKAPTGVTKQNAELFMVPSNTIYTFMCLKGYDVTTIIKNARKELNLRPIRVSHKNAKIRMNDFFKSRYFSLGISIDDDQKLFRQRKTIIKDIMTGVSPEKAIRAAISRIPTL